jgi:hypothetical protein
MTAQAPGNQARPARKVGYLVAVIVNVTIWVVVNVRPGWRELPFLTEDFLDVLWLVNLSLVTSAVVNLAYLFYDPAWFKSVSQIGLLAIGMAASIRTWQFFPFDFSSYMFPWDAMARVLLGLAIFGSFVAIVVELVRLARLARHRTMPADASGADARSQSLPHE